MGWWESIPAELRDLRQWVGWRLVAVPGRTKPTKQPLNPRDGALASTSDPATWATFDEACGCLGADGIGFVFTTGDDYVGVDLDHCRDAASGEVEPWALRIVGQLSSYSEISPSGTGIHVIVSGALPTGGRKLANIEMYSEGRYFTVTGQVLPGTPPGIAKRSAELAALHAETFGPARPSHTPAPQPLPLLSDEGVIERASQAANGTKFRALWAGDQSSYPSQSEADLALCAILSYWTGGDAAAIDRLFRRSGLYREKWDERHGAQTYGQTTIGRALAGHPIPNQQPATFTSDQPGSERMPNDYPLTDSGNAEVFATTHVGRLLFDHRLSRWLSMGTIDGTRTASGQCASWRRRSRVGACALPRTSWTANSVRPP